jgi:RNA polymerase sigma factor (sigma-70 family)
VDPLERVMARALRAEIDQLLESLSTREREVMTTRFGLDGRAPRTLAEVGRRLGVTRQRVQQIEEEAMVKLRHPARCARLREFV